MSAEPALTPIGRTPDLPGDAILVVSCVRDERLRLPWFLQHHRNLGVDHFIIIDNDSSDGTRDYLQAQDDVSVFHTSESYAQSDCGIRWVNALLNAYAIGHWTLVLDADELFIYPDYEVLDLRRLTAYLEVSGAEAMRAPLLDMYAKPAIADTNYVAGASFLEACPYFDCDALSYIRSDGAGRRAGPRHRLFWQDRQRSHPSPFLVKIPLMKWRGGLALEASTHVLRNARLAQATGMLLHFKLLHDFAGRVRLEADRKEHFADARQYAAYAEVISTNPALSAYYEGSLRYEDSRQLVRLGLMTVPPDYPSRAP